MSNESSESALGLATGVLVTSFLMCLALLGFAAGAGAQRVDGVPDKAATTPVNLQMTPTSAFVRIRGWSLPAPLLPLVVLGSWGGKGTINGNGDVNIPIDQISTPSQFQFQKDINGEDETMTVSLFGRGDWTGNVNPLTGNAVMHVPLTLKIEASHVRMVDIPWPGGWIYGNIECTVPLDFDPMTTARSEPPDASLEIPPITEGKPYSPSDGQFTVINNSMTTGGFDCSHPDIGAGEVEDELNAAVNIPGPAGRTDSSFNMTFLEGGNITRPQPAIRNTFTATPGAPLDVAFNASNSTATAGVLRYVWDFDGDGGADEATAEPAVTHTFPAAGTQKVGLRILDKDGDASDWTMQDVTVSTTPGPGVANLAPLRISPKMRKAKPGKTVTFKVRVANTGLAPTTGTSLCVKGPRKMLKLKKTGCFNLKDIAPGQSVTRKVKVKLKMKARGSKKVGLRFKATTDAGLSQSARGRIRITG